VEEREQTRVSKNSGENNFTTGLARNKKEYFGTGRAQTPLLKSPQNTCLGEEEKGGI